MIREVEAAALDDAGKKGPQVEKTKMAQKAVEEFLDSGMDACAVPSRP